jgi:hypothetical protein
MKQTETKQAPQRPHPGGKSKGREDRKDRVQVRRGYPEAITPDGRLTGRLSGATAQAGEASAQTPAPPYLQQEEASHATG